MLDSSSAAAAVAGALLLGELAAIARTRRLVLSVGPGVWGGVQQTQARVSRLDVGVGVSARLPLGAAISADWRWRIAGNADPVSGPAVTASVAF